MADRAAAAEARIAQLATRLDAMEGGSGAGEPSIQLPYHTTTIATATVTTTATATVTATATATAAAAAAATATATATSTTNLSSTTGGSNAAVEAALKEYQKEVLARLKTIRAQISGDGGDVETIKKERDEVRACPPTREVAAMAAVAVVVALPSHHLPPTSAPPISSLGCWGRLLAWSAGRAGCSRLLVQALAENAALKAQVAKQTYRIKYVCMVANCVRHRLGPKGHSSPPAPSTCAFHLPLPLPAPPAPPFTSTTFHPGPPTPPL